MTILKFYHNFSCIFIRLGKSINEMISRIPFSTINNIPITVKGCSFTLALLKAACLASSLYILKHIFQKFSNTSANNNVLP